MIAYGQGGVRDSVLDGVTGVLYPDPTVEGLMAAIERFEAIQVREADLRANAAVLPRSGSGRLHHPAE